MILRILGANLAQTKLEFNLLFPGWGIYNAWIYLNFCAIFMKGTNIFQTSWAILIVNLAKIDLMQYTYVNLDLFIHFIVQHQSTTNSKYRTRGTQSVVNCDKKAALMTSCCCISKEIQQSAVLGQRRIIWSKNCAYSEIHLIGLLFDLNDSFFIELGMIGVLYYVISFTLMPPIQ